jgi:hypothetical protein
MDSSFACPFLFSSMSIFRKKIFLASHTESFISTMFGILTYFPWRLCFNFNKNCFFFTIVDDYLLELISSLKLLISSEEVVLLRLLFSGDISSYYFLLALHISSARGYRELIKFWFRSVTEVYLISFLILNFLTGDFST